ncbi:MAG: dihydroorotase [Bacteroidales bacterium]
MQNSYRIINALIVNEGQIFPGSVQISKGIIERISRTPNESDVFTKDGYTVIDGKGKYLLPGIIDSHVHFRDPGLTQKADILTESRAAVAGGITSFMEMPNTIPQAITLKLLEEKFLLASDKSLANYSFFLGASNDNIAEIIHADPCQVCGVKVFFGASTGNMLVDNQSVLEEIFRCSPLPVVAHCEDEFTIRSNAEVMRAKFGEDVPIGMHPLIRSAEACYISAERAVNLAKKYGTRLHLAHLSTARELELLDNNLPLERKRITAEVCTHYLWFCEEDYSRLGAKIKVNPSIKSAADRDALLQGLHNGHIDIIATDHAPHLPEEKAHSYFKAPSGTPLVQHSLPAMLELWHNGKISLELLVEKMCHAPAISFGVVRRGFIREGFQADLVLVDPKSPETVDTSNILYKCGWSPFEGHTFQSKISHTFVNGNLVYHNGRFDESVKGQRLLFAR